MRSIPDAALRQMLVQMTQTGQVGTPEYLLAAGEIQSRKDARAKAAAGQGNPTPIIADLLTGGAMPPQMPMLPENAGGVAALPAPNMDNVAEMAAGGLVAFEGGGSTFVPRQRGVFGSMFGPSAGTISREEIIKRLSPEQLREFNRTGALPDSLKELVGENVIAPVAAAPVAAAPVAAPAGIEALGQTQAATVAPAAPAAPTVREKPSGAAPAAVAAPALSYEDAFKQAQGFAEKVVPGLPAEEAVDQIGRASCRERVLR
jgi:hypothetical protein